MLRAEEKSGQNPPGSGEAGRQVISRLPARGAGRVAVGGHDQSRQVSTSQVGAEWVGQHVTPQEGQHPHRNHPGEEGLQGKRKETDFNFGWKSRKEAVYGEQHKFKAKF